jgi:MEMO1 family protein
MIERSGWVFGIVVPLFLAMGTAAQEGEPVMKKKCMESTLAGSWYDADPAHLRAELKGYLRQAGEPAASPVFAVVLPHAGYTYSGPCAAFGAKALRTIPDLRRVIVLGFSHRIHMPNQVSLPSTETHYESPLGETPLDTEAIAGLMQNPLFSDLPATRQGENSVEMQLPLLQVALESCDWSLLPVTLGQLDNATREQVAAALQPLMDEHTALVVSSDFTHYGPNFGYVPFRSDIESNLRKLDGGAIETILTGDAAAFDTYCEKTGITLCGRDSIGVLLRMLPSGFTATELAYDTSGSGTGDFDNSVSYAALSFGRKGAPMKKKETPTTDVLPAEDKIALLALARKSIATAFETHTPPTLESFGVEPTPGMNQVMGGFVTLTIDGALRGCIGEIFPRRPLAQVVMERARDSAFEDTRFAPLTEAELAQIRIEISALTPPVPVDSYRDIEIGRHGMVLELNGRSAVFLPQVAPEQGWNLPMTLTYLAQKAGLPPEAWKDPAAKFTVFEAIVFHE